MKPKPPFIKLYKVAEQLGCSVRTVRNLVSKKRLRAWRRSEKGERVTTQEAIDEYVLSLKMVGDDDE